jgi:DNA-directed RNA polymerase subunit RPC12/RpoP
MSEQIFVMAFYRCEVCEDIYAIDSNVTEEPVCPYCGQPYFTHLVDQEIVLPAIEKRSK